MKLYIAVLDTVPSYMVPTLVAHAVLGAHLEFFPTMPMYKDWLSNSFRKVVLKVNYKEFEKISLLEDVFLAHENKTLEGTKSCVVVSPRIGYPNVINFAKMWKP